MYTGKIPLPPGGGSIAEAGKPVKKAVNRRTQKPNRARIWKADVAHRMAGRAAMAHRPWRWK